MIFFFWIKIGGALCSLVHVLDLIYEPDPAHGANPAGASVAEA